MKNEIKTVYGCEEIIEVPMKTLKDKLQELIDTKNAIIEENKEFIAINIFIILNIIILVLLFLYI